MSEDVKPGPWGDRYPATPRGYATGPEGQFDESAMIEWTEAITYATVKVIRAARDGASKGDGLAAIRGEILDGFDPGIEGFSEPLRLAVEDHIKRVVRAILDEGELAGSEY
jgi:hypothetical protein